MIPVRALRPEDRAWFAEALEREWDGRSVVSRGRLHHPLELEALVAELDGARAGAVSWRREGAEVEVVTLHAEPRRRGVGRALLESVAAWARRDGARRLWLVTTNDNRDAIAFYRALGMRLATVHRGAVDEARRLKPGIPRISARGEAIVDELEFEWDLQGHGGDTGSDGAA